MEPMELGFEGRVGKISTEDGREKHSGQREHCRQRPRGRKAAGFPREMVTSIT